MPPSCRRKAPNTINQRLAAIRWYARKIADLAADHAGDEISRIETHELVNKTDDGLDIAIVGKGGKVRVAYVNDGALAALLDWLDLRGNEPGALFVAVNKGGRITGGRLSGEALRKMLDKRSREAQLSKPVTWHDFRRTFAGNLWDAKIDGVTIQKLMGHASQNQTAKYDRRPEATRRAAVKVLHVPYKRG
jgi:integrase